MKRNIYRVTERVAPLAAYLVAYGVPFKFDGDAITVELFESGLQDILRSGRVLSNIKFEKL